MLTVSDVMSRNVLTVDAASKVRDVAAVFGARGISGAPVTTEGRVVGVVSKTDLVRVGNSGEQVREIMTPLIRFVRPEHPAQAAVDIMLASRVHRVLVLDVDGGVAGIVTPADVLRAERSSALRLPSIWPRAEAAHAVPEDGDFF